MAFVPAAAALILSARAHGGPAARSMFARGLDAGRLRDHPLWWPLFVLIPAVVFVAAALHGDLAARAATAFWAPPLMLALFLIAALGEELGWTGYLLEPLAERWGELIAALILGLVWALWHLFPFLQADRSAEWIVWQSIKTVADRVVIVRLYFGGGRSVFAVTLLHALSNTAVFALPLWGGTYDPRVTALVMAAVATVLMLSRRRDQRPARRPPRGSSTR
jgi:membrane protease YdiL (CAAX protease family)